MFPTICIDNIKLGLMLSLTLFSDHIELNTYCQQINPDETRASETNGDDKPDFSLIDRPRCSRHPLLVPTSRPGRNPCHGNF